MAPPRLKCLNASRQMLKSSNGLRATFSTSAVVKSDEEPSDHRSISSRPPVTDSDLLNIGLGRNRSSYNGNSASDVSTRTQNATPRVPSPPRTWDNPISRAASESRPNNNSAASLLNMLETVRVRRPTEEAQQSKDTLPIMHEYRGDELGKNLAKRIWRKWRAGDAYAPHDLSESQMKAWRYGKSKPMDIFDQLNMNPLDHYRNFTLMSQYMTPMGRIIHSKETQLRPVNQRKISKAVRRMIGMGMMPSVHRHPELIIQERDKRDRYAGIATRF